MLSVLTVVGIMVVAFFWLHRMHEMQSIVIDVRSVCLSLMLLISASLCKNGWTDQDAVWDEHSWEPVEHCVKSGSWSPQREGEGPSFKF